MRTEETIKDVFRFLWRNIITLIAVVYLVHNYGYTLGALLGYTVAYLVEVYHRYAFLPGQSLRWKIRLYGWDLVKMSTSVFAFIDALYPFSVGFIGAIGYEFTSKIFS